MPKFGRFFRCVGEAIVAKGLKGLAGLVPFGESLYEVAADALNRYRQGQIEDIRVEVEAAAQATLEEVRQEALQVVQEVAAAQPAPVQQALADYLTLVPAAVRQSLKRPSDPTGTTVPPNLKIERPEQLLPMLPARPPRFHLGDRPTPGGNWELVELLGVGGFGEVWKAQHPRLKGLTVALKFCLDPQSAHSLRHEAALLDQVMQQTSLPGIVPLRQAYLDSDPLCLEYEFVAGGDLANLVRDWQALAAATRCERVHRLVQRLATIVGGAHRLQPAIVHRDLKPANILILKREGGRYDLRVTDFGIGGIAAGHALATAQMGTTTRGDLLAMSLRGSHTPLYAPPQQIRGEPPDPRDDVHALGVIWYQLLTGDLCQGISADFADDLRDLGLSAAVIELLGKCVAGKAERRPADAAVLAELLGQLTGTKPPPPPPPPAKPQPSGSAPPLGEPRPSGSATRQPKPGTIVTNSLGMKLVLIPPGKFLMGSPASENDRSEDEGPQHEVEITQPFYLGVYQVTQAQYEQVMGTNPSSFTKAKGGGPDHPVEQVSWEDAVAFCRKLSERPEEKQAGRLYRLPTEAEWEYSCRGGASSYSPFHYGPALSSTQANFDGNYPYGGAAKGPYLQRTCKVGSYQPNAFGLYDMHGNVWEWCADWYDAGYYQTSPTKDPQGPEFSPENPRVLRGGSWFDLARNCRAAFRYWDRPDDRYDFRGFRLACLAPPRT